MREEDGQGDDGETVGFTFVAQVVDLAFVEEKLARAGWVWVFQVSCWRIVTNVHVCDVRLIATNGDEGAFEIYTSSFDSFHFAAG